MNRVLLSCMFIITACWTFESSSIFGVPWLVEWVNSWCYTNKGHLSENISSNNLDHILTCLDFSVEEYKDYDGFCLRLRPPRDPDNYVYALIISSHANAIRESTGTFLAGCGLLSLGLLGAYKPYMPMLVKKMFVLRFGWSCAAAALLYVGGCIIREAVAQRHNENSDDYYERYDVFKARVWGAIDNVKRTKNYVSYTFMKERRYRVS